MRILKGDIIAASGEFIRGSGLECGNATLQIKKSIRRA